MNSTIAGVDSFDRVSENIKRIVMLKKKYNPDLLIGAKIMIDANNYGNLPGIVKFYKDLGVDSVGLRLVQDYNYGGIGPREPSVTLLKPQKKEIIKTIKLSDYKHPSLLALSKNLMNEANKPEKIHHCYNAIDGHFACIDAWGNVYLGNPEIGIDKFKIGNINCTPWEKIWKSDAHYRVIRLMENALLNESCHSDLCRHVKANVSAQEYIEGKTKCINRENIMKNLGAFL